MMDPGVRFARSALTCPGPSTQSLVSTRRVSSKTVKRLRRLTWCAALTVIPDAPTDGRRHGAVDYLDADPVAFSDARLHQRENPLGQRQVRLLKGPSAQTAVVSPEVPIMNYVRRQVIPGR